jgi:predicted ABC-type ATPase
MPNLFIIAGCNGAGKTTASYTILPEIFNCKEFVNADSIAAGLSPFNPENVALEAGRIMLTRIETLMQQKEDFAIETTLATRSYVDLIKRARHVGYKIKLIYFWLRSPEEAILRVATRVSKGGHNIPNDVVERRYFRGIYNLINLYMAVCDNWLVVNNNETTPELICEGEFDLSKTIFNYDIWNIINEQSNGSKP